MGKLSTKSNKVGRLIDADEFEKWLIRAQKNTEEGAAEDAIDFGVELSEIDTTLYFSVQSFIDTMRCRPTVDAEIVRYGRWETDRFGLERSICSICNATYEGGEHWHYCPNCGAKMIKGQLLLSFFLTFSIIYVIIIIVKEKR